MATMVSDLWLKNDTLGRSGEQKWFFGGQQTDGRP